MIAPVDCPDPEQVSGFVARTLGADGVARVDAHIADCAACRNLVFALAPEPAREVAAPERLGRFEILDVIGHGTMGIVYRARDPELDRFVAIKARRDRSKLAADAEERLRREARALARLAQPNVVAVHEMATDRDIAYIAMEHVDGVTLDVWLAAAPRTRAAIIELIVAAGRGLAAAHARGLIHRDFKPSNVLVSTSGVAKVGDFGLVRVDRVADDLAGGSDSCEFTMTSSGSLVGTPAYMAPEQLRGEVATEASDQFSFCVTLYEALYGRRPFAGDSVGALLAAIERGPWFPVVPGVPARIRRALARGLRTDPAARFPAMTTLLARLAARHSRALWIGAAAAAGIAATAIAVASTASSVAPCGGGGEHLREAWNGARATAAERAFVATKLPYAAGTWTLVSAELDRYAGSWIAAHEQACLAGRRGETSPAVLDVRMQCLGHRLDGLRALGDALVAADAAVVRRATRALTSLAPIERCLDLDANLATVAPPADSATRAAVDELRRDLEAARVTLDTGRFDAALAEVTPLVATARALGYAPVLAEALYLLGRAHTELEHAADARAALDEAARTAYAAHHDEVAARAWIDRIYADYQGNDLKAGAAAAEMARAALARVPNAEPARRVELLAFEGVLYNAAADYKNGAAKHREALALAAASLRPSDDRLATIRNNLANALFALGQSDEAIKLLREAIAIRERGIGATHPDTAENRGNLARQLAARGDYRGALAEFDRAIAALEASVGDHPALATMLANSSTPLQALGRVDDALARARRALTVFEQRLGKAHPVTATAMTQLATMLAAAERPADAVPLYREALAIQEAGQGGDHPSLATTLNNLGFALLDIHDVAGAIPCFERALAIVEKRFGKDHQRVAYSLVGLGQAYVARGDHTRADVVARRAVAVFEAHHAPAEELAEANAVLAASHHPARRR